MTDKELKNILQSSTFSSKDERYNDADFTHRVMFECSKHTNKCLEHTNKEVRTVIWTIRIIAVAIAIAVLFLLSPSTLTSAFSSYLFALTSYLTGTFTSPLSSGSYLFAFTSSFISSKSSFIHKVYKFVAYFL